MGKHEKGTLQMAINPKNLLDALNNYFSCFLN